MKRYNRPLVLLLCLGLVISCEDKASISIKDISWLQGSWRIQDGSGIESWTLAGNEMKGTVFSNLKKEYSEALRIYPGPDKNLIYEATVKDQNGGKPVSYVLLYRSTDSLQFVNMNHDFPNYIEYKRVNDSLLSAHVYGKNDNGFSFQMTKVKMEN